MIFSTFSRVLKEKGICDAIQVIKDINSMAEKTIAELHIYGQVDSNFKDEFNKVLESSPDFVKYCGKVDASESVNILSKSYALLFPSYYSGEGFPGTIIDSFSAGVPVIASDWRYNAEIVEDKMTGLIFKTKDNRDFAEKVVYAITHPLVMSRMKINAVEEASKYVPEEVSKALIKKIK